MDKYKYYFDVLYGSDHGVDPRIEEVTKAQFESIKSQIENRETAILYKKKADGLPMLVIATPPVIGISVRREIQEKVIGKSKIEIIPASALPQKPM